MATEEAGNISLADGLPLQDFLECFPPPQTGRLIIGYHPDFDVSEVFDLPSGSVLNFHRQISPNVPLTFRDPWGAAGWGNADNQVKVTLPLEFKGRFKLMPFDPESGDTSLDHVYPTVKHLLNSFPVYAQANRSWKDEENSLWAVEKGLQFKLTRLIYRHGRKFLEIHKLDETKLRVLPLECQGDFTVLADDNEYTLADLVSMLPRRRRLQISGDITNQRHKIPGAPADFSGELFMEEPEGFVEASPADNPSLIIGLPTNLNMSVAPEENSEDKGAPLSTFANTYRNLLPLVARVLDWDEETTILENHFVKPGVELIIHGWTRQSKILAKTANNRCFAIPLSYQGRFHIKPQQFHGVAELEHAHPAYNLRVVEIHSNEQDVPLLPGDIIKIRREDTTSKKILDGEVKYLSCDRLEKNGKTKVVRLPVSMHAVFEEVLEDSKSNEYWIRELVTFVSDQELEVMLLSTSDDQKSKERDLPLDQAITLCDFLIEPAVYVSVGAIDSPAFHIPLRTLIYVTFIQQLEKSMSPLLTKQNPRLSTLDRCIEILPVDVFNALLNKSRSPDSGMSPSTSISQMSVQRQTPWAPVNAVPPQMTVDYTGFSRPKVVSRPSSVAGYDTYSGKPKGFAAKLRDKFRKHRSQENLHKSGLSVADPLYNSTSLSRPAQGPDEEEYYTRAPEDPDNALTLSAVNERLASNFIHGEQGGAGRVTVRPQPQVEPQSPGPQQVVPQAQAQVFAQSSRDARIITNGHMPTANVSATVQYPSDGASPQHEREVRVQPQMAAAQPVIQQHPHQGQVLGSPTGIPGAVYPGSPGGGYMLMPVQQPNAVVDLEQGQVSHQTRRRSSVRRSQSFAGGTGYMLVPVMQSPQIINPTPYGNPFRQGSQLIMQEDDDDGPEYFDAKAGKHFKIQIPPDGNLYYFSVNKMAEFLRHLRVEDDSIKACLRERIDGKKFSRMREDDLERFGLVNPILLHFRRQTYKRSPKFML